jgi:hypothetical protein
MTVTTAFKRKKQKKKINVMTVLILLNVSVAAYFMYDISSSEKTNDLETNVRDKMYGTNVVLQSSVIESGAGSVWNSILERGTKVMERNNFKDHLAIMEIGVHRPKQILPAVRAKFHTHCLEPSPLSFHEIQRTLALRVKDDPWIEEYLHLYNVAAGAESGVMLEFTSEGGTGDHIGKFNGWSMNKENTDVGDKSSFVQVPSLKVDDIIISNKVKPSNPAALEKGSHPPKIDNLWALKIDTQGYEPSIFKGLKESIKQHKIQYIITEYWPNGMALVQDSPDKCDLAVSMLTDIASAGYTLYALSLEVHPRGKTKEIESVMSDVKNRHLNDLKADCQFLLDLEKRFPNEDYHMGYWTDILAVAPGAEPF